MALFLWTNRCYSINSFSGGGVPFCFSTKCSTFQFALSVFLLITVVALFLQCVCQCFRGRKAGRPSQVNADFIRRESLKNRNYERYPFQDGVWSFQYHQYKKWHGPYRMRLTFDRTLGTVTGQGTDDVGNFTIEGIFSSENLRLALTQSYVAGTGNPTENLGHTSTIQLTWNSIKNRFEGKWYVETSKYRGHGSFEMTLETSSELLLNNNTEC